MKKLYAKSVKRLAIDMALGENPLGCSPAVEKALRMVNPEVVSKYPDMDRFLSQVSKIFGVPSQNIVVGAGSEQLIKLVVQRFVVTKDRVAIQRASFDVFSRESRLKTSKVELVDVDELKTAKSKFKLIFLCNPNNPTGEKLERIKIAQVIRGNPRSIIILDEAAGEFLDSDDSFIRDSIKAEKLLVLKTISKVFGGAGLRVGFGFGSKSLIKALTESQQAFPLSGISAILAIACLKDKDFVEKTKKFIDIERNFVKRELEGMGFGVSNSVTNNLLITNPDIKNFTTLLEAKGVSVIDANFFPGLKIKGFRISIRDKKTNRKFLNIIKKLKGGDKK